MITFEQFNFMILLTLFSIGLIGSLTVLTLYYLSNRAQLTPDVPPNKPKTQFIYFFTIIQLLSILGLLAYLFINTQGINPLTVLNNPDSIENENNPTDQNRAISREVELNYLLPIVRFRKGVLVKSEMRNVFSGTLDSVEYKPNAGDEDDLIRFLVRGSFGYQNYLSYSKRDVREGKMIQIINGKEQPLDVQTLKIGDRIEITSAVSIIEDYPQNRIELIIKKLE